MTTNDDMAASTAGGGAAGGEATVIEACDGLCVTASDVGLPEYGNAIVHAHPGCPLHDPGATCTCDTPERCMSPTHGLIGHAEAMQDRWRQNPAGASRVILGTPPAASDQGGE